MTKIRIKDNKELKAKLDALKNMQVQIGIFGAVYPERPKGIAPANKAKMNSISPWLKKEREKYNIVRPERKSVNAAAVAAVNEFGSHIGSVSIPARPFFRKAITSSSFKWVSIFASRFKKTFDLTSALADVGDEAVYDVQDSIRGNWTPKNAPYTEKMKGFNKPLTDSGLLPHFIKWRIKDE